MAFQQRVKVFGFCFIDCRGLYGCSVKHAEINERCEVQDFDLVHNREFSDKDVYFLEFTFCSTVKHLPRNLHHHFCYLKELIVHGTGLKGISPDGLRGLKNLEILNMSENNIKKLGYDLFFYTKKLRIIIFYKNKLEHISSRLLNSLPDNQLQVVDFRRNRRYNVLYDLKSHGSVRSIKHLKEKIASKSSNPRDHQSAHQIAHPSLVKLPHMTKKTPYEFKRLWEDKKLSDFKIVVGSKEVRVHKCVLAIESPVFAAMFENNLRTLDKHEIEGFTVEVVEVFLHSLYTGQVENADNALELFNLTSTYKVTELSSIYQKIVLTSLNSQNAVETLRIGNLHRCDSIIEAAFAIVKKLVSKAQLNDDCRNNPKDIETVLRTLRLDKD